MRKLGFTLAEVLITLVIIGVIAAMTVPTLMSNTQGQENKAAFKKAISSLNQALTLEYALDGNTAASLNAADIFKKRANVVSSSTAAPEGWTNNTGIAGATYVITADGLIYVLPDTETAAGCPGYTASDDDPDADVKESLYGTGVTACAVGAVDVNGVKGPNKLVTNPAHPEDQFKLSIYETKVVPGDTGVAADNQAEVLVMYDAKKKASS